MRSRFRVRVHDPQAGQFDDLPSEGKCYHRPMLNLHGKDPAPRPGARIRKWLFICGLWAIFAAFYTAQSYTYRVSIGMSRPLLPFLLREILYVGLWAALTPAILALSRRFPVDRRTWPTRIPFHILSALVLAVCQRLVYETVSARLRAPSDPVPGPILQSVLAYSDYGMFLYFIVLLIATPWTSTPATSAS
jgi:hypothetical protein